MKLTTLTCLAAAAAPLLSCSSPQSSSSDEATMANTPRVAAQALDTLKSRYPNLDEARAAKGVAQAAALWRARATAAQSALWSSAQPNT